MGVPTLPMTELGEMVMVGFPALIVRETLPELEPAELVAVMEKV